MNRFQRLPLFVTLFLTFSISLCFAQSDKLAITHGPYLQQPAEDSMTVVWFTNKKCVSKIEYATGDNLNLFPQWGSIPQTAFNIRDGLVEANVKLHKIRIDGLKPGGTCRYRIVSKQIDQFKPYEIIYGDTIASDIYQFQTLDKSKQKFSFYVFQDIHEDANTLNALLKAVTWDDVDLVFFNGDMINYFEDQKQIFNGFLDVSVDRFAKNVPFIFVRGNHEARGLLARDLIDYFPTSSGRFFYSFNHGPVHFIILDSGEDKADSHPVYAGLNDFDNYRRKQARWLKEDIKTTSFKEAKFRIVLVHMPLLEYDINKDWPGWIHAAQTLAPVLNEADIDLTLCGHTHKFAHINPDQQQNSYPVIIGAPDTSIRVDVSKEKLKITVTQIDGQTLDKFCIP